MDTNYILGREQISLHNAAVAASLPAQIAHAGLAAGYGALLADRGFPNRHRAEQVRSFSEEAGLFVWENEGGARRSLEHRVSATSRAIGGGTQVPVDATRGHVVQTPEEEKPYKVVLEHEAGDDTEHPVGSMREGEELIRETTPRPTKRDTLFDLPVSAF